MACHLLDKETHGGLPHLGALRQVDPHMTLETMISVGVFGWMAVGMVLMGLGIW